jgi:TPR repeat protein
MRDKNAHGCNLHEMMHAMGVHGHPSGDTVLTYFNTRADKFLPFDEFLHRAWYSPKTKSGMTPFQTMEALSRAWHGEFKSSRPDANEVRREFLLKTFADMEKFATEKGEVPKILIRSGMLVAATVAQARLDMNWLLGFSYQHGLIVNMNLAQAERWYKSDAR